MLNSLPNDIIKKIISLLDIDSRRALNIYSKLDIPDYIKNNIQSVLQKPYLDDINYTKCYKINLNSKYTLIQQVYSYRYNNIVQYSIEHFVPNNTYSSLYSRVLPVIYICSEYKNNCIYTKYLY